ncbi:L-2-hydroxyglutarate oxidase [Streptomyces sp. NBC_01803]|uniref:L-2-hydroxyglutarate oxidase n=1 Tax=Streptomyces sp. NBC_01803 TaxID=2975946 RepID=UPI003FA37CF3
MAHMTGASRDRSGGPGRFDCDVVVIGGGIVGLATAHALRAARPGLSVTVLEKESGLARHQTGRNSGVIHSGVYYRPGSLKATFAVRGAAALVKFCAEHGVAHAVPGKLIVATEPAELPRLHELAQRARRNGVPVRELGPAQITEHEPAVRGVAALRVETTGQCDFAAVARELAKLVTVRAGAEVVAVDRRVGHGVAVRTADGEVLRARALVNCAGLHSDRVARLAGDDPGLRIVPFRGEFYQLRAERASLVRGLVYPVPDPAFPFLGVHLTTGLDGEVHIGPNAVLALAREGYDWRTVRPRDLADALTYPGLWRMARHHWRAGAEELRRSWSKRAFTAAVRRLLPEVTEDDLEPSPAGVRAQAVLPDGTLADDFRIMEAPHTVHVLNAPSPAATACLPIGQEVATRLLRGLEES